MKIEVNIKKKYAFLIIGVILVIGLVIGVSAWDSAKKMWHSADDVKVRINNTDYSLQDAIDDSLIGSSFAGAIIINESSCHDVIFGNAGTWWRSHTGGNYGDVYRWVDCPIGEVMVSSGFAGQSSGVDDERTHATCCKMYIS